MKRLLLIFFILFPMLLSAQNLVPKKHPKKDLYGYWGTKKNGREGFVIPPKYEKVSPFVNNHAFVCKKGVWYIIGVDGKAISDVTYSNVELLMPDIYHYRVWQDDKCGLVDATGKILIPTAYDAITTCEQGGYLLKLNGKCGLADATGKNVLPVKYDEITASKQGGYLLKMNGKCGLVDAAYREVLSVEYDEIRTWPYGGYILKRNGKCGLIDNSYKIILPVKYDKFSVREQGGYILKSNNCMGIADAMGKELIKPEYKEIYHLETDMYALYGDGWSFANGSGQIVDVSNRAMYYTTNNGEKLSCERLSGHKNLFCEGKGVILFDTEQKEIGERAFYNCTNMTSITIPNSVTSIDNSAFHYCRNLVSITIPDNVAGINSSAFEGCDSLPIVDGIRYAGNYLLEVVDKYRSTYTIKPETRLICDGAFINCIYLSSIVIPDNVISIGNDVFAGCDKLRSMTFGNSIAHLGFIFGEGSGNENIQSIYISDIKSWCQLDLDVGIEGSWPMFPNAELYLNNQPLTSVVIPSGVTHIGSYAFYNCSSLTSVEIPLGVTAICVGAFQNCKNLKKVTISCNIENIATDAFVGCSSLPVVDNIRYVGSLLVEVADKSKTSYTLKNGTRVIGDGAFKNCIYLKSITIPASVQEIGLAAFEGCKSLRSFYCKATTPPRIFYEFEGGAKGDIWQSYWCEFIEGYPFREIKTTIYVPKKSERLYKEDFDWMCRSNNIIGYNF